MNIGRNLESNSRYLICLEINKNYKDHRHWDGSAWATRFEPYQTVPVHSSGLIWVYNVCCSGQITVSPHLLGGEQTCWLQSWHDTFLSAQYLMDQLVVGFLTNFHGYIIRTNEKQTEISWAWGWGGDSCFLWKHCLDSFWLIVYRNSLIGNSVFHQTQSDMWAFSNSHVILTFATKSKVKGAAILYCHLFVLSKDWTIISAISMIKYLTHFANGCTNIEYT